MKPFRVFRWLLAAVVILAMLPPAHATAPPTLPNFAGWQKIHSQVLVKSGWGLPAADVPVLAEYGLVSLERDLYQRGQRTIQVEGLRFADAGGAYGAFTYYRPLNFHAFDLAQPREQAASGDTQILFTRGLWLIRVQMDTLTAMTASEMRQLAANLGSSAGQAGPLPSLPYYLPRQNLIANSTHYVEGPAGFAAACSWLSPQLVGFNMGAEAELGSYSQDSLEAGTAQMVVIAYPTPQIARTHLAALQKLSGFEVRRTGPILVLVQGATGARADQLLQAVNYDADVTMVPPTPVGIEALPSLILGIFVLCGLIIAVSIVVGLLTGGIRVLVQRVLPERFHKTPQESLIRLNLK